MSESDLLATINQLVDDEHKLRAKTAAGEIAPEVEQRRLAELETTLDQCWDLLRRRRAQIDSGQPAADAHVQSADQVEGYLQ
ncbi:DUF2630 family protein [Skermania sp. ID1734]|uniref:DUF2630 family protein n=1 Tax=Skermania sp. ID1734 TaxID=2597516 RepID=UPI00118095DA|nr:DUF2630 family protein [Skermania sp. ID1734]TSD99676.1 DUF2630 family protein [Skermania sp. ID1734]